MLRAFADESEPGSISAGVFNVSGYVAFPCQWESFADEWNSANEHDPAFKNVGFYKSSALHSQRWRKEHGITKGDANRMESKLVPIIQHQPILFSAVATLDCKDWLEVIRQSPIGDSQWANHPYYFCYQVFCAITLRHVYDLGIVGDQVDFVFDYKDAISDRANEMFALVRDDVALDPIVRGLMGVAEPGFDNKLPPLQAADILASRVLHYCRNPMSARKQKSLLAISGVRERNRTAHLKRTHFEKYLAGFFSDVASAF
jgi:hypothetical protein